MGKRGNKPLVDEHMDDVGSSDSSEGGSGGDSGSCDEKPIESPQPSAAATPKSSRGTKGKKKVSPKKAKSERATPAAVAAASEDGMKVEYES